jgi:hypothetical protein
LILLDELISKLESNFHKVNRRDSLGESRTFRGQFAQKFSQLRKWRSVSGDGDQILSSIRQN